jgi:2'-5' RNA ligase
VVLYRSDLTADGPVYTALDRVVLSGAPGTQR